jgi:branched-chain amino acid transport system permease protein
MVIMVVTGGKGTLVGPIVGGVVFGIVPEVLRGMKIVPEVQWIVYGVLMIAIVYFLPEGIVPAVQRVLASGRRAFAGSTVLIESKAEEK